MSLSSHTTQQQPSRPQKRSQWHPEPSFHLKPPQGWMNDPCAPGFDVATGTYNLSYQCEFYATQVGFDHS